MDKKIYLDIFDDYLYTKDKNILIWSTGQNHQKLFKFLQKNPSKDQLKLFLNSYVDKFYEKNMDEIKQSVEKVKRSWDKTEKDFYKLTTDIFNDFSWPKGSYQAYATVWNIYPRDIKKKIFWFPYRHEKNNYPLVVIAHEMLHFVFFDYAQKTFNLEAKINGRLNQKLWDFSEAFNIVIQNSPKWISVFGGKCLPFPQHKNLIKQIEKFWLKDQNIEKLIQKFLE